MVRVRVLVEPQLLSDALQSYLLELPDVEVEPDADADVLLVDPNQAPQPAPRIVITLPTESGEAGYVTIDGVRQPAPVNRLDDVRQAIESARRSTQSEPPSDSS